MLETIKEMYQYNSWATGEVLKTMRGLSSEQYDSPGCSGNGSIHGTLVHLMSTQNNWVLWFNGKIAEKAQAPKIKTNDIPTVESAEEFWRTLDAETTTFIESLTVEKLLANWSWISPAGSSVSLPLWKILLHIENHGTHTRAQIMSAVRRLGVTPNKTDLVFFELTKK